MIELFIFYFSDYCLTCLISLNYSLTRLIDSIGLNKDRHIATQELALLREIIYCVISENALPVELR